jgi:hypothetical protein
MKKSVPSGKGSRRNRIAGGKRFLNRLIQFRVTHIALISPKVLLAMTGGRGAGLAFWVKIRAGLAAKLLAVTLEGLLAAAFAGAAGAGAIGC